MASYSISSAMVKQSCTSAKDRSCSAMPACASARCQASAQPSNLRMSRRDIGRKSCTCCGGAEHDRLVEVERGLDIGEHQRRRAVGDQRTVGALERAGDQRILLALGAAEIVAEVLPDLRVGIADAVLVVLGGDRGRARRTGRPSAGNKAPRSCRKCRRSRRRYRLPRAHRRPCSRLRPISAAGVVVICSTPTTSTMRAAPAAIDLQPLMHRGGAGGAGVLDPGGALEAQIGRGLQHQRSGEILRRKAGIEMAEHDLVDVLGRDRRHRQAPRSRRGRSGSRRSRRRACRRAYAPIPQYSAVMIASLIEVSSAFCLLLLGFCVASPRLRRVHTGA